MHTTHVDVLVVGGGPAGLLSAIALNKAGHSVRIVDKRATSLVGGRADGLMSRTLEVLQSYNLMDYLFQEGSRMFMAAFYRPTAEGIQFAGRGRSVEGPRARWHYEVTLNQGMLEEHFAKTLSAAGIHVERPAIPESIDIDEQPDADPNAYAVKTVLRTSGGAQERVLAKYVIGADGASSWVRGQLDISMDGDSTGQIWGVVDFVPETNFPDFRNRAILMTPGGTCLLIPREANKIRIYVQLDHRPQYAENKKSSNWNNVGRDEILDIACMALEPFEMRAVGEPEWWSIFQVEQRVASRFASHGRVFIVGDACHTHSPQAGQGLNAGINDTHNLAWKISQVLHGHASASLLQTYEDERRAFAHNLIRLDKIMSDLRGKQDLTEEERTNLMRSGSDFVSFYSGIGIRYAPSSIVSNERQELAGKLVLGERMHPAMLVRAADGWPHNMQDLLPSDGRYKVLIFASNITQDDQISRVRELSKAFATPFWRKNSNASKEDVLDVLAFAHGVKSPVDAYTTLRAELGLEWTKIFVDVEEACEPADGRVHANFSIGPEGAVIVVRPDGYVAAIAHCDARAETELAKYFQAIFM